MSEAEGGPMQTAKKRKKILVVKPSSLGDIVNSLPFLRALRKKLPEFEIHWVIAKGLEELLEGHPMIDRLWVVDKDSWKSLPRLSKTIKEFRELARGLKAEKFDAVLDLQGLLRSGLICAATHSPVRVGFAEAREGSQAFYSYIITGGKNVHAVERYIRMAAFLGADAKDVEFPLSVSEPNPAPETETPYILLAPGARWATKRWPAERFGRVAARLPIRSIVIGGADDVPLAEQAVAESGGKAVSMAGETGLKSLISLISGAKLLITNDSGPMHIASALGVPIIAIFGPTSPKRTGPYGDKNKVLSKKLNCSPCFKKKCKRPDCMTDVAVEDVFKAAREMI